MNTTIEDGKVIFPAKLQQRIISSLSGQSEASCGLLLGRWFNESLIILSAYHCPSVETDDIKDSVKESGGHFPGGISICGLYFAYPSSVSEDSVMRYIRQNCASIKDQLEATNLLICVYQMSLTRNLDGNSFWYHVEARETSRAGTFVEDQEVHTAMWQDLVTFRLRTTCQLIVPYYDNPDKVCHSLGVELGLQIDSLVSQKTAYHIKSSRVLLQNPADENGGAGRAYAGVLPHQPCSDIFHKMDLGNELKAKRKIKDYSQEVLNVSILRCATPLNEKEKAAFLIYVDEVTTSYLTVQLPVDCLVVADSSEPVGNLPDLFTRTLTNQLTAMGRCMCSFYQAGRIPCPLPVHIQPLGMSHVITVCYPVGYTDDQLADYRRWLHARLHLATDRPLLRPSNRYLFPDEKHELLYLQNPHKGLAKSGGGDVSCVDGVYDYHHYMQDNVKDTGWGCAYRSLQTIVSWFRHQGYTQQPVPTHAQIQQALVDVGDKEKSFVGSRRWIGSTEVGYCLDHLLGVQSRYLVVNAGSELSSKGRDLAEHFQRQGTPIMIGGGVLAHTILGVDFNQQTGDVKFLILDPHYTGPEDLKEIQSKGWCGWKGPEFWDQTAFYNLCMPQRPKLV